MITTRPELIAADGLAVPRHASSGDRTSGETTWAALGALRFALAGIVFLSHSGGYVALPTLLGQAREAGPYAAVLAFLFVSGYSIAHSLARGSEGFYSRRLARIYPIYFLSIVLGALPFVIWGPVVNAGNVSAEAPYSVWPVIGSAIFLEGIAFQTMLGNSPAWSLTLEVIYYAFAPLFRRLSSAALLWIVGASALLYLLHNRLGAEQFMFPRNHAAFAFLLCVWLAGFWFYRHRDSRIAQISLPLFGLFILDTFDQTPGRYASLTLAGALVVVTQAHALPAWPVKLIRTGHYLGNLSYPLYLLHTPLLLLICGAGVTRWFLVCPAVLLGAAAAYHGVDAPYRRYASKRSAPHPR